MPLQNRVAPDGTLVASPIRGTMMGNRGGRFHNSDTLSLGARRWSTRQWICCVLDFRNRSRTVWRTGYTELFFCDEVTALAAGHRPCYECRRNDALAFARAMQQGLALPFQPQADMLDVRLHGERLDGREKKLHPLPATPLPDGAMIIHDGDFYARRNATWLRWSFDGYSQCMFDQAASSKLVTPLSIIAALRAGYSPRWHASADAISPTGAGFRGR
ncbi:MAG: hypothetical protein ACRCXM_00015 [Beijerinckiaceae bacterium]